MTERTRHYLQVLDRFFRAKSNSELKDKIPVALDFTSDFNLMAVLKTLGISEVQGKPVAEFRPQTSSYLEIEILPDDSAKIYYQGVDQDKPELLASVEGYHDLIKH